MQEAGQVTAFAGTESAHHVEQHVWRDGSPIGGVAGRGPMFGAPCAFVAHDHLPGSDG
jgi:hypothetical protein